MNETLKKFTEELKAELIAAVSSSEMQAIVKATKDATDSGTFEVIISTNNVDRSGDVVDQKGWDLTNYKNNPVVLYGHDYYSLPIGVCDSIEVVGDKLIAKGRFAPMEANPFAQQVRKLYDLKILRTTSVGFIVKETEGNTITKSELLEFSFVPVPANPYALSMRQVNEMNVDVAMLCAKGINLKVKDEEIIEDVKEDAPEEIVAPVVEPIVAEEVVVEEKGAIADELNEEEVWEQKWAKLDGLSDIINAFYNVYLDEATPVTDFDALVTELSQLLGSLATATTTEGTDLVMASVKTFVAKNINQKEYIQKAGKRLSTKSTDALAGINDSLKNITATLDTFIADEVASADNQDDGTKTIKRSKSVGSQLLLKGLNDFLVMREVLRSVDNVVGGALENINKSIREKSQKK